MIKAERAQAETMQSDIVGYYPRSKLPFRAILKHIWILVWHNLLNFRRSPDQHTFSKIAISC